MDWSIQDIARLAGITSRTLRHYGDVGLLPATRVGSNGYRRYDERALARLQRILMLRGLGLGIPAIAEVLDSQRDDGDALEVHLRWLREEKKRLDRQIASVETTIEALKKGTPLMAQDMFDGFDHTRYKDEVENRWGATAYADSDAWWRAKTAEQKAEHKRAQAELASDWIAAHGAGEPATGGVAQALAHRQAQWLGSIPGTPGGESGTPTKAYFIGLGEMYVADERFAAHYGGVDGAAFVRDAMTVYAEQNL